MGRDLCTFSKVIVECKNELFRVDGHTKPQREEERVRRAKNIKKTLNIERNITQRRDGTAVIQYRVL